MSLDLLLRDVRLPDAAATDPTVDIAVAGGRIAEIRRGIAGAARETVDGGGRVVSAGFIETHIHLDKTCILGRCACETTRNPHRAMERVSEVKHTFTVEDVTERASRTLEKCISHGCTRMRTHVEVDPKVGLRGLEGVKAAIERCAWAIDIEICVMPQEGLTNNPGTDELMVAALKSGATVVGAASNYDTDRPAQIRRVFELAREFDLDIDMHLDSGASAEELDTLLVCELTERYGWGGRGADRAAGDRSLSRRARPGVQRAPQRGGREPARRSRRAVLDRLEQHPQPVHPARRRAVDALGESLRQHRPARDRRRPPRDLGHVHRIGGAADAPERLRHRSGQPRRPGGGGRADCGGCRA